ncbi:MAG: 3-deoxy-manno-octulosonate cytidylyltransferase [Rikenellaceae bacterium]
MSNSKEKFIAIIPARYASTRFEGKPLVDIFGQTMIERVYRRSLQSFNYVVVATDDMRIYDCIKGFGGEVVMTSADHKSGTDRCAEALKMSEELFDEQFDVVVNVQGDEPFVASEQLESLKECFSDSRCDIATLVKPFSKGEDIFNPNSPKVVLSTDGFAIYFSRSPIPFLRGKEKSEWMTNHTYFKHLGLYGYRKEVLFAVTSLDQGVLEKAESLEQLRWLENGYKIKCGVTYSESYAIDTPEDLEKVLAVMNNNYKL